MRRYSGHPDDVVARTFARCFVSPVGTLARFQHEDRLTFFRDRLGDRDARPGFRPLRRCSVTGPPVASIPWRSLRIRKAESAIATPAFMSKTPGPNTLPPLVLNGIFAKVPNRPHRIQMPQKQHWPSSRRRPPYRQPEIAPPARRHTLLCRCQRILPPISAAGGRGKLHAPIDRIFVCAGGLDLHESAQQTHCLLLPDLCSLRQIRDPGS